jgi:hypothetical protein
MDSAPGFIFWRQVSLVYSRLPSLSVVEKRAVDRVEFPTVPCATKSIRLNSSLLCLLTLEACYHYRDFAHYLLSELRPVANWRRFLYNSNSSKPRNIRPRWPGVGGGRVVRFEGQLLKAECRGDEQLLVRGRDRDVVCEALRDAKANVCRSVTRLESPAGVSEHLFKVPE